MALPDFRERWERMAPREQKLLMLLAATAVVLTIAAFAIKIGSGLAAISERNEEMRSALRLVAQNKGRYLAQKKNTSDPTALIGDEAPPLATYLESIASEVGVEIPESREADPDTKGKFVEKTIDIKMRGLTIQQLGEFVEKVETKSPIIVVKEMSIKTQFREKEKLDAEFTIATYEKAKPSKKGKKGKKSKKDDE